MCITRFVDYPATPDYAGSLRLVHFTGIARIHQTVRFAGAAGIALVGALPLDGDSRKSRDVCDSRVLRVMGEAGSQRHGGAVRSVDSPPAARLGWIPAGSGRPARSGMCRIGRRAARWRPKPGRGVRRARGAASGAEIEACRLSGGAVQSRSPSELAGRSRTALPRFAA